MEKLENRKSKGSLFINLESIKFNSGSCQLNSSLTDLKHLNIRKTRDLNFFGDQTKEFFTKNRELEKTQITLKIIKPDRLREKINLLKTENKINSQNNTLILDKSDNNKILNKMLARDLKHTRNLKPINKDSLRISRINTHETNLVNNSEILEENKQKINIGHNKETNSGINKKNIKETFLKIINNCKIEKERLIKSENKIMKTLYHSKCKILSKVERINNILNQNLLQNLLPEYSNNDKDIFIIKKNANTKNSKPKGNSVIKISKEKENYNNKSTLSNGIYSEKNKMNFGDIEQNHKKVEKLLRNIKILKNKMM